MERRACAMMGWEQNQMEPQEYWFWGERLASQRLAAYEYRNECVQWSAMQGQAPHMPRRPSPPPRFVIQDASGRQSDPKREGSECSSGSWDASTSGSTSESTSENNLSFLSCAPQRSAQRAHTDNKRQQGDGDGPEGNVVAAGCTKLEHVDVRDCGGEGAHGTDEEGTKHIKRHQAQHQGQTAPKRKGEGAAENRGRKAQATCGHRKARTIVLSAQEAVHIYQSRPRLDSTVETSSFRSNDVAEHYGVNSKTIRDIWKQATWVKATRAHWGEEDEARYVVAQAALARKAALKAAEQSPRGREAAVDGGEKAGKRPRGRPKGSRDSRPRVASQSASRCKLEGEPAPTRGDCWEPHGRSAVLVPQPGDYPDNLPQGLGEARASGKASPTVRDVKPLRTSYMGVYSQTTEEGNSTERRVSSNEGTRSHGSNHSSFPTDESNGNSDNGSPDHPEYDAAHTSILAPPHQQSRYAPSRENSPGSPGMAGARSMAPEGGRSPYAACWGQQAACWGQQDAWPRGSESWCGSAGDCQGGGVAAGNAKCLTDAFGLPRGY